MINGCDSKLRENCVIFQSSKSQSTKMGLQCYIFYTFLLYEIELSSRMEGNLYVKNIDFYKSIGIDDYAQCHTML
jgi:hypothetical protein